MTPDNRTEEQELIHRLESDLKLACDALKEIQELKTSRIDALRGLACIALKNILWGGKDV